MDTNHPYSHPGAPLYRSEAFAEDLGWTDLMRRDQLAAGVGLDRRAMLRRPRRPMPGETGGVGRTLACAAVVVASLAGGVFSLSAAKTPVADAGGHQVAVAQALAAPAVLHR